MPSVYGQNSAGPQPVPLPPPIPAPVDAPYAGTISLSVDLTNVNARVLSVRETIPVKPGELTLLYPQWLPGTHSLESHRGPGRACDQGEWQRRSVGTR